MKLRVIGTARVINALASYNGPKLRKLVIRASRKAMQPVLADVKASAPMVTGRLRASLSIHELSRWNLRNGEAGVAIYPSNNFTYGRGSAKRAVARSLKAKLKANARGIAVDENSVWNYAHIVETGQQRDGKRRNPPRWFLRNTLERRRLSVVFAFTDQLGNGLPKSGGL